MGGVAGRAEPARRNGESVNQLRPKGGAMVFEMTGEVPPDPIGRSVFEITSEVITGSTGGDGPQDSAWSGWVTFTAPPEHVIDDTAVEVEWQGRAGSENRYEIAFDEHL